MSVTASDARGFFEHTAANALQPNCRARRSSPVRYPANSQRGCCKIPGEASTHSKAGFE